MSPTALPETIFVTRWHDLTVDTLGHHVLTDDYVERFWLPVIGPTPLWLLRNLARHAEVPEVAEVNVSDLATALGLRSGTGRWGVLAKSAHRVDKYANALQIHERPTSGPIIRVRTHLADVPIRLTHNWPASLHAQHDAARGLIGARP